MLSYRARSWVSQISPSRSMCKMFSPSLQRPSQHNIREMHKVWFKSRRPTVDELWASRHPTDGFARTRAWQILRKIATLEELLQQATETPLVQRAQMLLLDHLMLMCIEYTTDHYTHYLPDYETRFYELVGILGIAEPSASEPGKRANISTPVPPARFLPRSEPGSRDCEWSLRL